MKPIFLALLLTFLFSTSSQAQFFEKLANKAEKAVERTVERRTVKEVEKSTNRALDTIIESPKDSKGNTNKTKEKKDNVFNPFGGGETSYEASYTFPVTAVILFEDYSRKSEKTKITQQYGKNALATKMADNNSIIIMDFSTKTALMLDVKENTGQAISMDFMNKMTGITDDSDNENTVPPKIEKTGRSKTLNGYSCDEYKITSEDGIINAWIARNVDFEFQDFFKGFAKMFSNKNANFNSFMGENAGFVMEMMSYDTKNKKLNSLEVTSISKTPVTYNTAKYTIQKL